MKLVLSPKLLSTRLLLAVRNFTSGRASHISPSNGRPMKSAYRSEDFSASDLGTSSPSTSDRYEMSRTTMVSAMKWAWGRRSSERSTIGVRSAAKFEPPNAPAVADTTVMPICTVARKSSGWCRRRKTARADLLPRSTSS